MKFMGGNCSVSSKDLRNQERELQKEKFQEQRLESELEQQRIVNGSTDNLGRPVI